MFIKVGVFLLALSAAAAQEVDAEWVESGNLAVAISDQVELLYSNGSRLGAAVQQFSKLKALAFDNIRDQFLVSDMDQNNDTIYSVDVTKETDKTPIVADLPDDIQGLAVDPITDILYWTNAAHKTMNYVSLHDPIHESKVLLQFENEIPQDVAIDVCRRYIYWTNSNITGPTIERATLDGRNREVLVKEDLFMPSGITVDSVAQRIYWADKREGIYSRIESARLDGSSRQILFEGTHQRPFGIAVDKEAVYWTDINNNALWKKKKKEDKSPEKLRHFKEQPMGLVSKHMNIQNISECSNIESDKRNAFESHTTTLENVVECLNGGEFVNKSCRCRRGFSGTRCETSCHNFCIHGSCHLSSLGYPRCHCPDGFTGARCEHNMCDGFCLNEGSCLRSENKTFGVFCQCREGFVGQRCEVNINPSELCGLFCRERQSDVLMDQRNTFICRCEEGAYRIIENTEDLTAYQLISSENSAQPPFLSHFQDTSFTILSVCMLFMLGLIVFLSAVVCKLRRQPRIKKRIIVNKNVTPLTYRPQPTSQQCEITIENCCNMNVCETPCFEPPQLKGGFQVSKKEEKKTLLANMENGDDLY